MAVSPTADVVIRTKDNSSTSDADTISIFCETAAQALRAVAALAPYVVTNTLHRDLRNHTVTASISPRYDTDDVVDEVHAAAVLADLAITITASPTTAAEGANIVYTITVTNNGPDVVSDVAAAAPIPSGLTTTANTPAANTTFNTGTGAWVIGSLASGASKVLSVTADADAGQSGNDIDYVVSVSGTRTDGTPANNTDTQTVSIS